MQTKLIIASLAASASAGLLPRQTDAAPTGSSGGIGGISKACQSDINELQNSDPSSVPTLPSFLSTITPTGTQLCDFTPPASASSEWNSFTQAVKSWADEHEDMLEKIKEDCTSDIIPIPDLSSCKAASNDDSDSDNSNDSDSDNDNNDNEGAAALNGPTAMGAVLVAGVAAAIAL